MACRNCNLPKAEWFIISNFNSSREKGFTPFLYHCTIKSNPIFLHAYEKAEISMFNNPYLKKKINVMQIVVGSLLYSRYGRFRLQWKLPLQWPFPLFINTVMNVITRWNVCCRHNSLLKIEYDLVLVNQRLGLLAFYALGIFR